ncbi:PHP domain-containing protein [Streptococcus macacae]|uniref:Histidinol-phosphatase n=1 Tax=Streptococcus macacae NCTC 11558 TaxID=764298 RepID=G5JVQ5_9STRE|nr:PHP domain-containing protein [Streptococcus macacae]EHJ52839.1 histidinol phosphate phosphatase, HisJ family [Streptococcus macacae NCTC 11558]SUN78721.1 histidinol-phosphatase [Streptococcus macacae NCTC 11558]
MRDNHLHTHFSYDSRADFKDYLDHYEGDIITTEHYDLSNPYTKQDDVPDYEAYSKEIAELNQTYGNRIKRGIEIGYYQPREADIISFLADKDYDLKLLSLHHNGFNDYLDDEVANMDKETIIQEYLDKLEYAIGRVEADVLAHFDYGFRLFDLTVEELKAYEPQLRRIFQKMIDYGLAFELNSKSMYLYHHEHLYRYALGLVKELGCRKYSVGSDGHKLEHFRLAFDKIQTILDEYEIEDGEII